MKVGVLFWGFKDLNLAAECAKLLKKNHGIKEFYMQISVHEKTISLLDIFPEEIIRSDYDDFNFFYKWLSRNHKKNIIIVIDFWMFLSKKNFLTHFEILRKIFDEPFHFLICCPKYFHEPIIETQNKKLINIADKTYDFFKNVHLLYELSLNSSSSIAMLSYPPCLNLLNTICGQDFFNTRKISFLTMVPSVLNYFPSLYISKQAFLEGLEQKIFDLSNSIQNVKGKDEDGFIFNNLLKGDTLNIHYKYQKAPKKKKNSGFLILSSLERFYKMSSKEEIRFLLWLIYLAILEHKYSLLISSSKETEKKTLSLFSSVPV